MQGKASRDKLCSNKTTSSGLLLSRIPRDSLKHFEIFVSQHTRVAEVRKTINQTTTFKWICSLTPEVRNIYEIMWKRGEIAPEERFLLFSTIFCYLYLDFYVKTGTRISLRYKRLFEISDVEITRVDCIYNNRLWSEEELQESKCLGTVCRKK